MENDQLRFNAETGEEAHYWFCLSDFVDLSLKYGIDKVLLDVLQLKCSREKELNGLSNNQGC
jgi:hypothetical protein